MTRLAAEQAHRIDFELNGEPRSGVAEPRMLLSDFLRHVMGATGTHVGCEHGVCGACTVRIDGAAVRACLTLAVQVTDRRVETVEGIERDGCMDALQEAFRRHHALQCGYCTAGILMSCRDFLEQIPEPTEAEVRDMLSGHLCRCTGYTGIVQAVLDAAKTLRQEQE